MRADEFDGTYVELDDDKLEQQEISDTRKPKFTLRHLNKLKKMRSAEDLERMMRMDTLEIIYGAQEEAAAGGL
jgi:hypothetical protein